MSVSSVVHCCLAMSLQMFLAVPTASSLCFGISIVHSLWRNFWWLHFWATRTYLYSSIICLKSLYVKGIRWWLKVKTWSMKTWFLICCFFFSIKINCFLKIFKKFFPCFSLGVDVEFWYWSTNPSFRILDTYVHFLFGIMNKETIMKYTYISENCNYFQCT